MQCIHNRNPLPRASIIFPCILSPVPLVIFGNLWHIILIKWDSLHRLSLFIIRISNKGTSWGVVGFDIVEGSLSSLGSWVVVCSVDWRGGFVTTFLGASGHIASSLHHTTFSINIGALRFLWCRRIHHLLCFFRGIHLLLHHLFHHLIHHLLHLFLLLLHHFLWVHLFFFLLVVFFGEGIIIINGAADK